MGGFYFIFLRCVTKLIRVTGEIFSHRFEGRTGNVTVLLQCDFFFFLEVGISA